MLSFGERFLYICQQAKKVGKNFLPHRIQTHDLSLGRQLPTLLRHIGISEIDSENY